MAQGTKRLAWEELKNSARTSQDSSSKKSSTTWEDMKASAGNKTVYASWEALKAEGQKRSAEQQEKELRASLTKIATRISAEVDALNNRKPSWGSYDEMFESQKESRANISALRNQVEQYRGYMDSTSVEQILAKLDELDKGYDSLLELTKNNGVIMRDPEDIQKELDEINGEIETYRNYNAAKALVTPSDLDVDVPVLGPEIVNETMVAEKADVSALEQRRETLEKELADSVEWQQYCKQQQQYYDDWGHYADEDWFADAAASRDYVNPSDEDLQHYDEMMDNSQWEPRGDGTLADPYGNVITVSTGGTEYVHPMKDDPRYAIQDPLGMFKAASEDDIVNALATSADRRGTKGTKNDILAEGYNNHWEQITEEEENTYYAVLKAEGVDRALEFLRDTTEFRNARWGKQEVAQIKEIDNGFLQTVRTTGLGISSGMESWGTGLAQALAGQRFPTSGLQHANAEMSDSLTGLYRDAYNATYTVGNMLPSIVFTKLVGLGGTGQGVYNAAGELVEDKLKQSVLKGVGAMSMGVSAGGNAYGQALDEGYSEDQARTYGVLVGASEATLEYLIGGITELGGVETEQILKKLEVIDSSLLRISSKLTVKVGSEIFEEELQNYLEPAFRTILFGEEYDAPTIEELLETAVVTALSTGMLEGGSTVASDVQQNGWYRKAGKVITAKKGRVENLQALAVELGKNDPDLSAFYYKISDRVAEGDTRQVGRLYARVAESAKAAGYDMAQLQDKVFGGTSVTSAQMANATKGKPSSAPSGSTSPQGKVKGTVTEATAAGDGTFVRSTGQSIESVKFASVEQGKATVEVANGKTVSLSDVSFAEEAQEVVATGITGIKNVSVTSANGMWQIYQQGNYGANAGAFAKAAMMTYQAGFRGDATVLKQGDSRSAALNPAHAEMIYQMGRADAEAYYNRQQAKVDAQKKTAAEKGSTTEKKGGVFYGYEGQTIDQRKVDKDHKRLTKAQRVGIDFVKRLAKKFGTQFYFYESYTDAQGNRVYKDRDGNVVQAENGFYDPKDGSIHIDLNAGENGEGYILFTISHELVHFIKDWSPKQFKVMADIVVEGFSSRNVPLDVLIQQKMADDSSLTEDAAFEEVIASALEGVLADGKVAQFLQQLEGRDKRLGARVRRFFQDIAQLIRDTLDAYAGVKPDSVEGRMVMQLRDTYKQLQKALAEGIYQAGENFQQAEKIVANYGDLRYSKYAKVFFRENVFPPYEESHSEAHELSERWSRSESAKTRNRRLISFHNQWYLIQAFDDLKYGYQIVRNLTTTEYRKESRIYDTISGYESLQDSLSKNVAQHSGRSANRETGHRVDNDASKHGGENSEVYRLGADQVQWGNTERDSGRDSWSSSEDSRGKDRSSVIVDFRGNQRGSSNGSVFQRRKSSLTSRDILAQTPVSAAQNETERYYFREFKERLEKVQEQEQKQRDLTEQMEALEEGQEAERRELLFEMTRTKNRLDILRKKLREVEKAKPLEEILQRETPRILAELRKEYGTIPQGEKAVRDDALPVSTDGKNRVSRTARTVKGAEVTPDEFAGLIDTEVVKGELTYLPISNDETTQKAMQHIQDEGWEAAKAEWSQDVRRGKANAEMSAIGALLLNNAAQAGDKAAWLEILADYRLMGTRAAQAVQALRILKRLEPSDSLWMIQRSVEKMVKDLQLEGEVQINEGLIDEYNKATTDAQRDAAISKIQRDVAQQLPSTMMEMWTALRYVNMLGNFKTQGRNILGNIASLVAHSIKDRNAAILEDIVARLTKGEFKRTKSMTVSRALLASCKADFAEVESLALDGGKYADVATSRLEKGIRDEKRVFKAPASVKNEKARRAIDFVLTPLEWYRKATYAAMEKGDLWFSRSAYARSLAGYLKANGVKESNLSKVDAELLDEARAYAIREAQEVTFRDHNALTEILSSKLPGTNLPAKAVNAAAQGIMPFRQTPANVLLRAEEYSPLGIINSLALTLQAASGKTAMVKKKGFWGDYAKAGQQITGAQLINSFAKTFTGSGLFVLGMIFSNLGWAVGGPDDDDQKEKFDRLNGKQNYAIVFGDASYTFDWLAPSAIPFFMGVTMMENFAEDGISVESARDALMSITDPMIQMSMMQGLNRALDEIRYSENSGAEFASNALISYLLQGTTNSLLSQIERGFEDKRYSTYTDKNSDLSTDAQYKLGQTSAKIPGWDYNQVPYINAWGEEEKNPGVLANLAYNLLSPGYYSKDTTDAVAMELYRLHEINESDATVFPSTPGKNVTFTDKEGVKHKDHALSAEEYVALARTQGQTQRQIVESMVESSLYKELPDKYKVMAVQAAYDYSREYAQIEVLDRDGFSSDWMGGIKDNATEGILSHVIEQNIKGMFLSGDITADEAVNRRVKYCGDSKDDATEKVAYWNFTDSNPEYAEWTQGSVTKFYDYAKPANISMETYDAYCKKIKDIKKKDEILAVIHGLRLTNSQKDALYRSNEYAESKLNEAPWN